MYKLDIFPLRYVSYSITPTFVPETHPCYFISWLLMQVTPSHVFLYAN